MLFDTPFSVPKVTMITADELPPFGANGELIYFNGNLYVYTDSWQIIGAPKFVRADIHLFFATLPNSSSTIFEMLVPEDTTYDLSGVWLNVPSDLEFSLYVDGDHAADFSVASHNGKIECNKGATLTIRYTHCGMAPENVAIFIPGLQEM